jgi:hypothetical protein
MLLMAGAAPREILTEAPVVCKALASIKFVDTVIVLFVNISVILQQTKVIVAVASMIVPVLEMVLIIGMVRVLLVSIWAVVRSDIILNAEGGGPSIELHCSTGPWFQCQ